MNAIEWLREFENFKTLVQNRRPNTIRSYRNDIELLYRFTTTGRLGQQRVKLPLPESDFDWSAFTEDMAINYVRAVRASGAKDSNVMRKIISAQQFFKFLKKKGVTTVNPWEEMDLHRFQRSLPRILSINEMNKLLNFIRQAPALAGIPNEEGFLTFRDRALMELLYSAALRVSELCNANWQDINWTVREITVTGKGNKMRICPLGQKALDALMEYAQQYKAKWQREPDGVAPIFLSQWNRRILTRTIPRTVTKWCRLAGVKRVNPHAIRHSAATHMLENGADIRAIQQLLGHASISTTEIYATAGTRKLKSVHALTHPRA